MSKAIKIVSDTIFFTEERFVSFLIRSPKSIQDITLGLNFDDFFSVHGMTIFKAIQSMELVGAEISTHSLVSYLNQDKDKKGLSQLDKIGGIDTIVAIASQPVVSYEEAEILRDEILSQSKKRKIQEVFSWADENLALDANDLITQVEKKLERIDNNGNPSSILLGSDVSELEERLKLYADPNGGVIGIESGYKELDAILDGFKPGEVSALYAPSSRYKSMLSSNIGWRLARRQHSGLWIPTEMTAPQLQERLLQFESGQNFRYLRADGTFSQYFEDIKEAQKIVQDLPIFVSKSQERDVSSIVRQIRKEKKWHDISYVIIDMLDHIYSHLFQENEISNQSKVVRDICLAAKDIGVHVMLVCHISKEERTLRNRHVIPMEDIKGSSSKFQDIETAISIMPSYRAQNEEGQYGWKGLSVNDISYRQHKRKLIPLYVSVQKNRNGTLGDVIFEVDPIAGNRIIEIGKP